MTKKTTTENIDDRQADLDELSAALSGATEALSDAECSETPEDFDANIDALISYAKALLEAARELRED